MDGKLHGCMAAEAVQKGIPAEWIGDAQNTDIKIAQTDLCISSPKLSDTVKKFAVQCTCLNDHARIPFKSFCILAYF